MANTLEVLGVRRHELSAGISYIVVGRDDDVLGLVADGPVPGLESVGAVSRNPVWRQHALELTHAEFAAAVVEAQSPPGQKNGAGGMRTLELWV